MTNAVQTLRRASLIFLVTLIDSENQQLKNAAPLFAQLMNVADLNRHVRLLGQTSGVAILEYHLQIQLRMIVRLQAVMRMIVARLSPHVMYQFAFPHVDSDMTPLH